MKTTLSILIILFSLTQVHAAPEYVVIRQHFFSAWTVTHVEAPKKNLQKWLYDKKTDTYYRVKTPWGTGIRARFGNEK